MDEGNGRPAAGVRILRSSDQACVAAMVVISLGLMAAVLFFQGFHCGRMVDVDRAERISQQYQLDVNSARWPEWVLLPGIGETLARRIVASRRLDGPFRSHDDLLRVKGVGPRTLENMRPHLLPLRQIKAANGIH